MISPTCINLTLTTIMVFNFLTVNSYVIIDKKDSFQLSLWKFWKSWSGWPILNGGEKVSTGILKRRLHVQDAVGLVKKRHNHNRQWLWICFSCL